MGPHRKSAGKGRSRKPDPLGKSIRMLHAAKGLLTTPHADLAHEVEAVLAKLELVAKQAGKDGKEPVGKSDAETLVQVASGGLTGVGQPPGKSLADRVASLKRSP